MKAGRDRPHPRSPVQLDRPNRLPVIVLTLLAVFIVWKLRDTWVDALAPPVSQPITTPERVSEGQDKARSARGNLSGLISADDYPMDALRNAEQGRVRAKLIIDRSGRVSKCSIAASSGWKSLDRATCRILSERARFTPARDSNGKPVEDSYTQSIVWQLQ